MQRGEFRVIDTKVRAGTGSVLYAVDALGCRHLLVPMQGRGPLASDRRSRGVQIVSHRLVDADESVDFLDVACRKVHLNELFSSVADDMLGALSREPGDPVLACRRVLASWRELLDREQVSALSREALIGLFGELWHLEKMVRRNPQALSVWRGPSGEPHDFRNALTALEVKSTGAREGCVFEIHGVGQLEPPQGGVLFLATLRAIHDDAGVSVPDLVSELRSAGVETSELLASLARVGYDSRADSHYREVRFRAEEHQVFPVDGQFPKIVPASFAGGCLPPRVMDLRYSVDLAGCPALTADEVESLVDRLAEVGH